MPSYSNPLRSPVAWRGGKARLAKTIVSIMDQVPHDTYVEPFAGGASVFFYKPPSKTEVLNDLNPTLMGFYQKMRNDKKPICRLENTLETFKRGKEHIDSGHWNVCDFLAVNKNTFGANMVRYSFVHCPETSLKKGLCNIVTTMNKYEDLQLRLKNASLHNKDYTEIVKKYDSPTTFFYADPPYQTKTSEEYGVNLETSTLPKLVSVFSNIKGKVLISFNDSPEVRKAFQDKGFYIKPVVQQYSSNQFVKHMKQELLIANFPLKK